MDVIRSENYIFDDYAKRIKDKGDKELFERDYQELISKFLKDKIFINTNIEVIDVSNNHSIYSDDGGLLDLLLTRKYQYNNVNSKDSEYIATIEI